MTGVPPGRHPNWCGCQGCRRDIAEFESRQFKGTLIAVLILAAATVIAWAAHAVA